MYDGRGRRNAEKIIEIKVEARIACDVADEALPASAELADDAVIRDARKSGLAAVKVKCVESVTVIGPKFELLYAAAASGSCNCAIAALRPLLRPWGAAVATLIVVPLSEIELILTGVPGHAVEHALIAGQDRGGGLRVVEAERE